MVDANSTQSVDQTTDQPDTVSTITALGDGIVHAITNNPKAIAVADGVVTIEPTIFSAIKLFISIFHKHHNVPVPSVAK